MMSHTHRTQIRATRAASSTKDVYMSTGAKSFLARESYNVQKALGSGSYGLVMAAFDSIKSQRVAIKRVRIDGSYKELKQVAREIRIMRFAGCHPRIMDIKDAFVDQERDVLYMVLPIKDSDLSKIIYSNQSLSSLHVKYFMMQIFDGLCFLHKNGIIHRDLKPANILVNKNAKIFIGDFGLARVQSGSPGEEGTSGCMSTHIVTRWYRAPELMLIPNGIYDGSVDMWSAGCILGKLLGRTPMFPGKDFIDQLSLIFDVIGAPEPSEISHIQNGQACAFLGEQADRKRVDFVQMYPDSDTEITDLLDNLLVFNPARRISARVALEMPMFEPYGEILCNPPIVHNVDIDSEIQCMGKMSRQTSTSSDITEAASDSDSEQRNPNQRNPMATLMATMGNLFINDVSEGNDANDDTKDGRSDEEEYLMMRQFVINEANAVRTCGGNHA